MRERTLGPSSAATSFWIESKTDGARDPVSWSSRSALRSALFAPGRGGAWWHGADDTTAMSFGREVIERTHRNKNRRHQTPGDNGRDWDHFFSRAKSSRPPARETCEP